MFNCKLQPAMLWVWCILILALAACQIQPPTPTAAPSTPAPTALAPASDLVQLPPVQITLQALRQQLQVNYDQVEVLQVEAVEWPDACLGIVRPDALCAATVTPGYRIVLRAADNTYEYHTDQDGNSILLAAAPEPAIDPVVLVWQGADDRCRTAQFGLAQIAFGECGLTLLTVPLIQEMNRLAELADFVATYAPFTAETPAGDVTLQGKGTTVPAPAEQRMIAEWARQVALEAEAGRSGASWGLVLASHQEGGTPVTCRDVTVYITGIAYATSCTGGQPVDLGTMRLNAQQLAQIYTWTDTLTNFEQSSAGDRVQVLLFTGAGMGEATVADQEAMRVFLDQIYTELAAAEPTN
jgi:hypothetical protein